MIPGFSDNGYSSHALHAIDISQDVSDPLFSSGKFPGSCNQDRVFVARIEPLSNFRH